MEKKVYYAKDLMKDLKKAQFKAAAKKKWNGVKRWVVRNKEIIITLAPIVGGILLVTVKSICKHAVASKQAMVKERYCYDPALGHYWELRRKLKNRDWVEISRRKSNGEKLGDILLSMGVLK